MSLGKIAQGGHERGGAGGPIRRYGLGARDRCLYVDMTWGQESGRGSIICSVLLLGFFFFIFIEDID